MTGNSRPRRGISHTHTNTHANTHIHASNLRSLKDDGRLEPEAGDNDNYPILPHTHHIRLFLSNAVLEKNM